MREFGALLQMATTNNTDHGKEGNDEGSSTSSSSVNSESTWSYYRILCDASDCNYDTDDEEEDKDDDGTGNYLLYRDEYEELTSTFTSSIDLSGSDNSELTYCRKCNRLTRDGIFYRCFRCGIFSPDRSSGSSFKD